ncbi:MAG: hypothetical protein DHS20C15_08210 [Planctomycetota bacterium]|nr:MAG: hypothetical protein DHS20C15_08210 [Planctomycetota bacterium]
MLRHPTLRCSLPWIALLFVLGCGPTARGPGSALSEITVGVSVPDDAESGSQAAADAAQTGLRATLREAAASSAPRGDDDAPSRAESATSSAELAGLSAASPTEELLDEATRAALLARTPGLRPQALDDTAQLPAQVLPRPAPDQEQATFPPADELPAAPTNTDPAAAPDALRVLRFAPVGEQQLVPQLLFNFSEPMVPLSSLGEVEALALPVRLDPQPPGVWRWIEPRVLVFEPQLRLPGATHYNVEVPAGTRSANGGALQERFEAVVSTSPLQVERSLPAQDGVTPVDGVFVLQFDQRIEPAQVLEHIRLLEKGLEREWPLRLVLPEELHDESPEARLLNDAPNGTVLLFTTRDTLPLGRMFRLELQPGMPSLEGPRRTETLRRFNWRTPAPLELDSDTLKAWPQASSPVWVSIAANNELDPACAPEVEVTCRPGVPDLEVELRGRNLVLKGSFAAGEFYHLFVGTGLRDVYGQQLAEPSRRLLRMREFSSEVLLPGDRMIVLDPFEPAALKLTARNVGVVERTLIATTPESFLDFASLDRSQRTSAQPWHPRAMGELLFDDSLRLQEHPAADPLDVVFDLGDAFPDDRGHALFGLRASDRLDGETHEIRGWHWYWVQRTQLAASVFVDDGELAVWVTSLLDGTPVSGAEVRVLGTPAGSPELRARSDASGLAIFELPAPETLQAGRRELERSALAVLVEHESDSMIAPANSWSNWWRNGWTRVDRERDIRWHTLDDRGLYRPGETVNVTGWARRHDPGKYGDTSALERAETLSVSWTVHSPRRAEVGSGTATLDAFGNFQLQFELPAEIDLGSVYVQLELRDADGAQSNSQHRLTVAEFRRPEYEVTLTLPEARALVGQSLPIAARASYFAGGSVREAPVSWVLRDRAASWRPVGWDGWNFGAWTPWWRGWSCFGGWTQGFVVQQPLAEFDGLTDAHGEHRVVADLQGVEPAYPRMLEVEAVVTDSDAQQWAARADTIVHPAALSVGLRSARSFVRADQDFPLEFVVTDLEGVAQADTPVALHVFRQEWVPGNDGAWVAEERDVQDIELLSAAQGREQALRVGRAGSWVVRASVRDSEERVSQTELSFWVAGANDVERPSRVEAEELLLIPDKQSYSVGDVAEVLVLAPFERGTLQLSLGRSGRLGTEVIALEGGSAVLEVPLLDAHLPTLHLSLGLVGQRPRVDSAGKARDHAPPQPAYAVAELELPVSIDARRLSVEVAPESSVAQPGATVGVQVCVSDNEGKALSDANVALIVVDESVHVAGGYDFRDPLPSFYPARDAGIESVWLRRFVQLLELDESARDRLAAPGHEVLLLTVGDHEDESFAPDEGSNSLRYSADDSVRTELAALGYLGGGGSVARASAPPAAPKQSAAGSDNAPAIGVRENLAPLAAFLPALRTDKNGCVRAEVSLPDRLTRWRVMVVAADRGSRFGFGESSLRSSKPLRVRASLPRQLRQGDRAALPVVLHNDGDSAAEVQLALEASVLELSAEARGRKLTVPAHDRVELLLPVSAPRSGVARLLFVLTDAKDPSRHDALSTSLVVERPTTLESFAIYGNSDSDAATQIPLRVPSDARPEVGELRVDVASTAFASLTDAVVNLSTYPYACTEQRASRQLALVALQDVLEAFEAPGLPDADARAASFEADMEKLGQAQERNGMFRFWPDSDYAGAPWRRLYLSAHVAHVLQRCADAGRDVPARVLSKALDFLQKTLPGELRLAVEHERLSTEAAYVIRASALNTRWRAGHTLRGDLLDLLHARPLDELPLEVLAWTLPILHADGALEELCDDVLRVVNDRAIETASEARFVSRYESDERAVLLHGERRTDGLLLEALITVDPKNPLIEKVVKGLLAHRRRGAWGSTQEDLFVLLGLQAAFAALESELPSFTARAWLGDTGLMSEEFAGRETRSERLSLPMTQLAELVAERDTNVTLQREGVGRMWWRVGLRYAPGAHERVAARDAGFEVSRRYEAIDDPSDVRRRDDGTWVIRRGASVRVHLELLAESARHHVALVDALPSGLEVLNPDLPVSASVEPVAHKLRRPWWWSWRWYEHANLRDERVEVFASSLPAGIHEYSYVARATAPGEYVLPPLFAEEMYTPETFGHGAECRVVVE